MTVRQKRYIGGAVLAAVLASMAPAATMKAQAEPRRVIWQAPVFEKGSAPIIVSRRPPPFRPKRSSWSPICAAFTEGSIEWYLFFCYIDPPPKEGGA